MPGYKIYSTVDSILFVHVTVLGSKIFAKFVKIGKTVN